MIKIRLSRHGRSTSPLYAIVATDSRSPRDGRFLGRLGSYNPEETTNPLWNLNLEEMKNWVSKGAVLSETVKTLLKKQNIQL